MSWIEWTAAIITLISVAFQAMQKVWGWPTTIAGVGIYVYVFWISRLYADVGLQIIFIIISIYGWYKWQHPDKNTAELPVTRATIRVHAISTLITIAFALIVASILRRTTNAALPYADSTLAAFSLLAQWQMARKYIENWFVWIGVDVFYIAMYAFKKLYVTSGLYAVFIGVCMIGYLEWKRNMKPSSTTAAPWAESPPPTTDHRSPITDH
jgi:nicotinamide mononucleotide transporter